MDLGLLKTFVEVYRTRHFGRAAENLHLTQSAVSARIKQLEESIGTPLLTRARNDIQLTPAGHRFLSHAEVIITAWSRARQDLAASCDNGQSLAIGGMYSLWNIMLNDWVSQVNQDHPDLALMLEAQSHEILVRKLINEALDVCFMFEAPQVIGLVDQEVAIISLIMVSTEEGIELSNAVNKDYIYVDWGISFSNEHARAFPDMAYPVKRMNHGSLALTFLLNCGGSAYLAEGSVESLLQQGKLFCVEDAPVITRQAYAVWQASSDKKDLIQELLLLL